LGSLSTRTRGRDATVHTTSRGQFRPCACVRIQCGDRVTLPPCRRRTPIGAELKRPSLGPKQGRRTPFGKKQKLTSIAPIRAIHRNHISQPQFHRRIMKLEEALMISKYLASALVITALGANMAAAQTATSRTDATAASAAHREGEWRASKLVVNEKYETAMSKDGQTA